MLQLAGKITRYRWTKVLRAKPALGAGTFLCVGIFVHDQVRMIGTSGFGWMAGLLILSIALWKFGRLCSIVLGLSIVLAGIMLAQTRHFRFAANHIGQFAPELPALCQIEVELDQPVRMISFVGGFRNLPPKQVTTAQVKRIKGWDGWIDVQGGILLQLEQPHPRLGQGQVVQLLGMLQRPSVAMNPGQFDWAAYYRAQGVLASMTVPSAGNVKIIESKQLGPIAWMRERSRELLAMGFSSEQSLDHALMRALLLGDNDPELRDVQEQFRRTGTSHHLAISGLHVAVLGFVVLIFCRLARLSPRTSLITMTLFVVIYGTLAMPSPPVIRSVLLTLGFAIGVWTQRTVDALNVLAVCAIGMLCFDPMDLFNPGFQLSFGTVMGMILLTRAANAWFKDPEDDIIAEQETWAGRRMRLWFWFRAILITSVVAYLVSMPVIAMHFSQLNPWAVLMGILLAPVVFLALIGAMAKVLLTLFWPGFAGIWANLSVKPMVWMRWILDFMANIPGGDVPLPAPSIPIVLIFYVLILLPFVPWSRMRWQTWSRRLGPVVAVLLLIIYPMKARWAVTAPALKDLRVTLLAVGAGQCCVVAAPGAPVTVIDAGSTGQGADLLRRTLGPFLRFEGRREIGRLFLTHGDYDHISAAQPTIDAFDVKDVLVSPHFRRHAADNPPAEQLLDTLDKQGESPRQVARGDRIDLGGGVILSVLAPTIEGRMGSNDCGLVMTVEYAGKKILLPADIQDAGMTQVLADPEKLKADVLVAPHHGSSEKMTPQFLEAVSPQSIVSSNDRTLTRKQTRFDEMIGSTPIFRTNRFGAVTIVISSKGEVRIDTHLKNK